MYTILILVFFMIILIPFAKRPMKKKLAKPLVLFLVSLIQICIVIAYMYFMEVPKKP